ncbi:MAG: hypothetical protein IT168_20400 [Bryobacterales bacterium]|nr:hypothetical protein [Bryobacterales bacterium]
MITNVFFATTILFMALAFYLLQQCEFLIPYRSLLVGRYGPWIAGYAALLFVNIFALIYVAVRKLLLKDTGRKLAHLEKQLRTGQSISEELTERLKEHSL